MSFADWIIARVTRRPPDFIVGGEKNPYLLRWWVIPRNPVLNIYLHEFLRDDDDRALHDHPWASVSILLRGSYIEHTIAQGGVHSRTRLKAPAIRVRWSGKLAHRIELTRSALVMGRHARVLGRKQPCWTLFITGPRYRQWGFHCPHGWVHWKKFTAPNDKGSIGAGCDA